MNRRLGWVVVVCAAFTLLLGGAAQADLYMKQNSRTDAFTVMGQSQPEKNQVVEYWFSKNRVRMNTGEMQSTIVDLDGKVMYALNHTDKTYSEMPLAIGDMIEKAVGEEGDEEATEAYRKMAESMMAGIEAKVTDSGETRKIKDWNCRKYVVEMTLPMGKSRAEIWATKDIKVDPKTYWTVANAMMASQPGFEKIMEEMKKIDGVVVESVTEAEVMGIKVKSTEDLLEIEEKAAPGGVFDIPKEYKKTENAGMMME